MSAIPTVALVGSGPAILAFVADHKDGIDIADVGADFDGPQDWIALARLIAAGLIDEDGIAVHATDLGESVAAEIVAMAANP
jgi:hypothetical protein